MRIDIEQSDNVILHYQVKITERLETSDNFHTVDRVITSPEFLTEQQAQNWLIKYLSR
jgi:hypothetical protein